MGEKRSRQLSTPQSDCPMVEVCDICGDVGVANEILICPECKTNREHSYCRKIYPNNRTNGWCCDECEGKGMGSSINLNGDVPKELVSNSLKSPMTSPCNRPTDSAIQRHASRTVHVPKEKKAVQVKRKESIQMAESVANMLPAKTQDAAKLVKETSIPKASSCAPAGESQFPQPINSGHEVSDDLFPMIYDIEKCKPTDTERQAENFSRVPARYSSWKGRFEIQGDNFHYVSPGYVAIPRARCFRRTLECSKRMPELLQFKLIPRNEIWRVFFQDDSPSEDDIGLYFYSGGNKRSSDYDFLMEFTDAHDLAMRCDLGEVRLYLFISKLLPDGYQKLHNEYYFWGVFQKIKRHHLLYRQ